MNHSNRPKAYRSVKLRLGEKLVTVLVHERFVGLGHHLESLVHCLLGGKESGAEVQGALLLAETASRHKHDARLVQNLVGAVVE